MNTKAMELPLSTIVTIIIVLFVLVGVGIFFFQQFGASKTEGFDQSQCVSMCQTAKSIHASKLDAGGLCRVDAAATNYCSKCPSQTCQLDEGGNKIACNATAMVDLSQTQTVKGC